MTRPTLDASGIGEYIHFGCCPRYFKLRFEGEEERKNRAWGEAFRPLSPLLYGAGESLEERRWEELQRAAPEHHDLRSIDVDSIGWDVAWEKSRHILRTVSKRMATKSQKVEDPILLYQVPLKGQIGLWDVRGVADIVAIWPSNLGGIRVRVFEVKASWKERTYHRIQVAIYAILLRGALRDLDTEYTIEGGVIHRQSEFNTLRPQSLPRFDLAPLIEDVQRLMSENGELNRLHLSPLTEVEYQLSLKCENCIYNECCFTRAIEGENICLLNLSRGEQKALKRHGIKTLEDLAGLKVIPERQVPYNFEVTPARDAVRVEALASDPILGPKLDRIVQRAQFMLHGIRPGHRFANDRRTPPWITGTGYGRLPEDSPPPDWNVDLGFDPGSLIRVYLHIQWDYMLDRVVMISGRVDCTRYEGEAMSVSKIAESLPDDRQESLDIERRLLEEFFGELFGAIQHIAEGIESAEVAPLHLYFFTRMERDRLMDAVRRQPTLLSAMALRDLLGLRQAIDQPMVSIVQDEIMERKGLKYPSPGLLPTLQQCYHPDEGWFSAGEWRVHHEDGSFIDLRKVFYHGFFNFASPYRRASDGSIRLVLESVRRRALERGAFGHPVVEGYYPVRARFGSQIPLEYIWVAKGRLTPSQARGNAQKLVIERCMWHDHRIKDKRITDVDLRLLGSKLCHALEHIERSIHIKNLRLGKRPIDVPRIEEFTLGEAGLRRACEEYLSLEYFSRRQQLYEYYALTPRQRVETGRSVAFQCTHVEIEANGLEIRGRLLYDDLRFPNIDHVVNACRVKGSDGPSSGDWMVATEVEWNEERQLEEVRGRSPSHIERSTRVIVENIDPRGREIVVKAIGWPSRGNFCTWHHLPTTDHAEAEERGYMQLFEEGRIYVLDEQADDIVAERASDALEHAEANSLYRTLDNLLNGRELEPLGSPHSQKASTMDFISWLRSEYSISPNLEQCEFIKSVSEPIRISTLQGPPGTGKTENLHWAVLAHVFAHKQARGRCRVLMVGPTHKAIHEFVSKLAKCWRAYRSDGGNELDDLMIIRIISESSAPLREVEGVRYVNYHEDADEVNELGSLLLGQLRLDDSPDHMLQPLIVCATPAGMYGLMKEIGGGDLPWGNLSFDLLAVDEASMMRLPDLILSSAFIRDDAQILIAGDHRQLPPIQVHDWHREDRRTIEEIAPFLSVQDFVRLLRGEDLGLEHVMRQFETSIPIARLKETYRCHPTITEFLRKWVYSKDGIDFHSEQSQTIDAIDAPTEGLREALKPQNTLVLIIHNEKESYQSNQVEARIAKSLVMLVDDESIGVITPHNAQRGLLRSELGEYVERVDTVEKFQGGQSDFIIISATVSDPDYVRAESDFLLNLNRLNVAISRMRKKLVVIASRSLFEYMPKDARDYDEAILWRGLLHEVNATTGMKPKWKGLLSEFLAEEAPEIEVEVYAA